MSSRTREINQSKALHGSNSTEMSCLPNELLEHILLFLPLQDAITMSSLSKTWLHVWNSLPIRKFHFDYVKGSDDFALREFVNSVDESLSTLKQRKSFITSFSLSMNLKSQQEGNYWGLLAEPFHNWVSLVLKNYVKEIHINIRVSNRDNMLTLPQDLFTSRSVVRLRLEGCRFPCWIPYGTNDDRELGRFKYNCLEELSLVDVVATQEQVQNLVNFSKASLEKLVITKCDSMKCLRLGRCFAKLRYVDYVGMEIFRIEGRRMTRSEYDQYLKQKYASCHPKEGGHLG